jgi:ATP-binding cassette subfamily F protein 3
VRKLSGGERARRALARSTREAPPRLRLDEPTNHRDGDAREALVQALNDYSGAVVVVSHDRHMLELIADRLVLVDGGTAREFDGSIDDYTALVLAGDPAAAAKTQPKGNRKDERRRAAAARGQGQALRSREKAAEEKVAKLGARLSAIDAAMFEPASAVGNLAGLSMSELLKRRAEAERQLEGAEAEWLAASEALEQLAA